METSTILKQKANEIIETLGKLSPSTKLEDLHLEIKEESGLVMCDVLLDNIEGCLYYDEEDNNFTLEIEEPLIWTGSARTCFGVLTKYLNESINLHQKEIEKLVQLNTNLLGLGEKK